MATKIDFPQWLQEVLDNLDWSQADLARKSGLATATISRIMSGYRKPEPESLIEISRAIRKPPEDVFRAAGLLPPRPDNTPTLDEFNSKYALLDEDQKKQVLDFMEYLVERKGGRYATTAPDSGKPVAPPGS